MNIAIIFAQKAPPKAIAVFFSNQIGYFDVASEQKPLLHVWSLAVEEQFYIFWPLILLALNKKVGKKGTLLFCALLSCISLLYSEYLVHQAPTAAFYLLPSRAWELGLGALLAMFVNFGWLRRTPCYAGALASIVGIALICVAVFSFNEIMPFPGIAALVPCAGAGLVIAAGESRTTLGGRLLSLPPFALIGRISYSLYLWHWPTLVFAHLYLGRALRFDEKCWVLGLRGVSVVAPCRGVISKNTCRGERRGPPERHAFAVDVELLAPIGTTSRQLPPSPRENAANGSSLPRAPDTD